MYELESKLQDDWEDNYDDFSDYLLTLFTEKEFIEKLVVIGNCHCCKKHSIQVSNSCPYLENCLCKCRHFRRWLYKCLYKYAIPEVPAQNTGFQVIEECESEEDNESGIENYRYNELDEERESIDEETESEHEEVHGYHV
jgi:hypothetical protein